MENNQNAFFLEPDFSMDIEPPSTDLLVPTYPGDTEQGGWTDFNYYDDWGTTGSTWNSYTDPDIQTIVIVGERMTLWEKFEYDTGFDLSDFGSYLGATLDSAFSTASDRGYITVGMSTHVGVAVTMDMSNKDIYVGFTSGYGPIVATGLTPEGMDQTDFLSGWSGSIVTGVGVGVVESSGIQAPVFGTPGMAVSFNINATESITNEVNTVLLEARQYYNRIVFPDKYY